MNFLQLAQKLRQECSFGAAGTPTTVVSQTGALKRVVDWTADAWRDLQNKYENWRWMRSSFTVNTVSGTDTYAYGDCTDDITALAISRFARWWADDREMPFKIYLQSSGISGQQWMTFIPWAYFKAIYKMGVQTTITGQPIHVSVDPQNNIVLGPNPNGVYVVAGDYQMGPLELTVDADTPDIPLRFHDVIVYQAMKKYAGNSVAPEVMVRAKGEGQSLMSALELDQLPQPQLPAPLA